MSAILRFAPRRRACLACGYSFVPVRSWHRMCRTCFAWSRVAICQRRMAGLIEGAGR